MDVSPNMVWKTSVTYSVLAMMLSMIGYLFYTQEIQYLIPTAVPKNYVDVPIGTHVEVDELGTSKKRLVHFYNPNCPCSKFNLNTYKALLKEYSNDFECYAVIQRTTKGVRPADISYLHELDVSVLPDKDKKIAEALGVYSTPQIVLLDEEDRIYYRGNYNQSRYCTNPQTDFAKIAIDSLLQGASYSLPSAAFIAYGCDLDKKTD